MKFRDLEHTVQIAGDSHLASGTNYKSLPVYPIHREEEGPKHSGIRGMIICFLFDFFSWEE